MKKLLLSLCFISSYAIVQCQTFGNYATGVLINANGTNTFYNNSPNSGPNAINQSFVAFQNASFGNFPMNSGTLQLKGAEAKTFRNGSSNVCTPIMHYTIYTAGARPSSPTFTAVNINFLEDCIGLKFANNEVCSAGNQKWQTNNANKDLTSRATGNYTLEIYYQFPGQNASGGGCTDNVYDSNNSNNYTANFTITPAILPLNLLSFSGKVADNNATLSWVTTNEINVSHFDIENSTDGIMWSTKAVMNAKNVVSAQYIQTIPTTNNANFYRIKMVDKDGSTMYSKVIFLKDNNTAIALLNNPAKGAIRINVNAKASKYTATLFNLQGRQILQSIYNHTGGVRTLELPVINIAKGNYIVKVAAENETKSFNVIVE